MIVFLHVLIALTSIILATYAYVAPSRAALRTNYSFVTLTLTSGLYLVTTTPGHMIQACMSGILYLSIVMTVTVLARRKLTTGLYLANEL